MKLTPKEVAEHILRWISQCKSPLHFEGVEMAITNCLVHNFEIYEITSQYEELKTAIAKKKISLGLIDRPPSDDEQQ